MKMKGVLMAGMVLGTISSLAYDDVDWKWEYHDRPSDVTSVAQNDASVEIAAKDVWSASTVEETPLWARSVWAADGDWSEILTSPLGLLMFFR